VSTPRTRSWLTDIWTTVATASGIGYLAASYSVSRWLTRTSRVRAIPPCDQRDLLWEDLECRTEDGIRLAGWVVTPARPRGTVALFHGLRGNRGKVLGRIAFLAGAGYRCVCFDHRGHGQSEGRWTSFGYFESRDVTAILQLIRRRWPDEPCAILGISMGAAAVCYAAEQARSCRAIILESMYHDLVSAFQTRLGRAFPIWFHRFRRGVIWVTERRLGLRLADLAPYASIGKLAPAPVLLLTGSNDPYAPPEDAHRLFESCREPRELCLVPRASHTDVFEQGGPFYQTRILDFLSRRLAA
jgi:alpha-beta hydrolase superfamily lysophospholipase